MGLFDHMTDDRRRQLMGVLLLFLGLLVGVSLATHVYFAMSDDLGPEIWSTQLGLQNRQVSGWMFDLLGLCAWIAPLLLVYLLSHRLHGPHRCVSPMMSCKDVLHAGMSPRHGSRL